MYNLSRKFPRHHVSFHLPKPHTEVAPLRQRTAHSHTQIYTHADKHTNTWALHHTYIHINAHAHTNTQHIHTAEAGQGWGLSGEKENRVINEATATAECVINDRIR